MSLAQTNEIQQLRNTQAVCMAEVSKLTSEVQNYEHTTNVLELKLSGYESSSNLDNDNSTNNSFYDNAVKIRSFIPISTDESTDESSKELTVTSVINETGLQLDFTINFEDEFNTYPQLITTKMTWLFDARIYFHFIKDGYFLDFIVQKKDDVKTISAEWKTEVTWSNNRGNKTIFCVTNCKSFFEHSCDVSEASGVIFYLQHPIKMQNLKYPSR